MSTEGALEAVPTEISVLCCVWARRGLWSTAGAQAVLKIPLVRKEWNIAAAFSRGSADGIYRQSCVWTMFAQVRSGMGQTGVMSTDIGPKITRLGQRQAIPTESGIDFGPSDCAQGCSSIR